MGRTLIIVESPNKVTTIKELLKNTPYEKAIVMASVGHIMQLKDGGKYCNCGIDPQDSFKAVYTVLEDKEKVVDGLKQQSELADMIYLCSDPDREGESIAWSLKYFLNIPDGKYKRATFHEISKKAILNALTNATDIDYNLVNSADARRKIDKMLGYRLSPIAKKYIDARSVGRCQSAGLKLVVDREKEILNFIPQEYWELFLHFEKNNNEYKAKYVGTIDKKKEKLSNEEEVNAIKNDCVNFNFFVKEVITKEKLNNTKPPFTTSTFQQEVSSKLNISVNDAMKCAQKLFEGINVNGKHISLITYIRTDSDTMAEDFQQELKEFIGWNYGKEYIGALKQGKKIENAQEGHECLRCVDLEMTPEKLSQFIEDTNLIKVYNIIYKRTIASMMKPEVISETTYVIANGNHLFNLVSKEQLFDGFKKVYTFFDKDEDGVSKITFEEKEFLDNCSLEGVKNFTKPKARFKEATFIKELENTGIGRPSTFQTILLTILDKSRGYTEKKEGSIIPTEKGIQLIDFLDETFPNLINLNYTSNMEKELDKISNGEIEEITVLNDFYNNMEDSVKNIKNNQNIVNKIPLVLEDVVCPKCGCPMIERQGKYGKFYGCSTYPKCKGIVSINGTKDQSNNNTQQ